MDMGNTIRLTTDRDHCSLAPRNRETVIAVQVDAAVRELAHDLTLDGGLSRADASSLPGEMLREQHFGPVRLHFSGHR
jgi:hypothetical protein